MIIAFIHLLNNFFYKFKYKMLLPFVYTLMFMGGIYAWKFFKRGLKLKKNDKHKTLTVSIMVFITCIIHMSIYNIDSLRDCL